MQLLVLNRNVTVLTLFEQRPECHPRGFMAYRSHFWRIRPCCFATVAIYATVRGSTTCSKMEQVELVINTYRLKSNMHKMHIANSRLTLCKFCTH